MLVAAHFWKPLALEHVECFRALRSTHRYPRHSHESYSIGAIEEGVGGNYYRGASCSFPAGSVVTMNPDEAHTGYSAGKLPLSYRMLYIHPAQFRTMFPELRTLPSFSSAGIDDSRLCCELVRVHSEMEAGTDPLLSEEILVETLTYMASRYTQPHAEPPAASEPRAVMLVKEYLQSCYDRPIRLVDLAQLTDLGHAHLIRCFRRALGITPHQYLIQARVRHARLLLAQGEPIASAAISTGFADQSHLTRHFKSITGLTPGQYAAGHFRSRQ
jgi:AraC-like DNA-binding protein